MGFLKYLWATFSNAWKRKKGLVAGATTAVTSGWVTFAWFYKPDWNVTLTSRGHLVVTVVPLILLPLLWAYEGYLLYKGEGDKVKAEADKVTKVQAELAAVQDKTAQERARQEATGKLIVEGGNIRTQVLQNSINDDQAKLSISAWYERASTGVRDNFGTPMAHKFRMQTVSTITYAGSPHRSEKIVFMDQKLGFLADLIKAE